jgi:hypothetical protein
VTCMQPIATVPASVIEPYLHAKGVPFLHSMSGSRCRNYRDLAPPLNILPPESRCEFRRVAPSPSMGCTPLNSIHTPEAFCSQTVQQMGLILCYLCGILCPMYHHHGSGQSVRPSHPSIRPALQHGASGSLPPFKLVGPQLTLSDQTSAGHAVPEPTVTGRRDDQMP